MDMKTNDTCGISASNITHKYIFSLLESHINKNIIGDFMYQHDIYLIKTNQKIKCNAINILNGLIAICNTDCSFLVLNQLLYYLTHRHDDSTEIKTAELFQSIKSLDQSIKSLDQSMWYDTRMDDDLSKSKEFIEKLNTLNVDCIFLENQSNTHLLKNAIIDRIIYIWQHDNKIYINPDLFENVADTLNICIRIFWDFSKNSKLLKYEEKKCPNYGDDLVKNNEEWIEYNCTDPTCICAKIKSKFQKWKNCIK
jgi:hypothetical protein